MGSGAEKLRAHGALPRTRVGTPPPIGRTSRTERAEIADGGHAFAKVLADAERPTIVLGSGAVARDDGAAVLDLARRVADRTGMITNEWNGYNILHRAASRVGGLDLGFLPGAGGRDVAGIVATALSALGRDATAEPARA